MVLICKKDTNGEVFMFTGLSSVKYIIDGQNSTPIVSDDKLDLENSVRNTLDFMVDFRNNKVCDNISESSPAYSASFADDIHIFLSLRFLGTSLCYWAQRSGGNRYLGADDSSWRLLQHGRLWKHDSR